MCASQSLQCACAGQGTAIEILQRRMIVREILASDSIVVNTRSCLQAPERRASLTHALEQKISVEGGGRIRRRMNGLKTSSDPRLITHHPLQVQPPEIKIYWAQMTVPSYYSLPEATRYQIEYWHGERDDKMSAQIGCFSGATCASLCPERNHECSLIVEGDTWYRIRLSIKLDRRCSQVIVDIWIRIVINISHTTQSICYPGA